MPCPQQPRRSARGGAFPRWTGLVAALWVVGAASSASAAPPSATVTKPTIAVLYFDVQAADPGMTVLRKGLAQMLVTDLVETERWTIVERSRLEAVLGEQKLQATTKMDRATVARVGKLLGARWLVLGSVVVMAGSARLDAHLIDVETGAMVGASKASGKDDDFFGLEARLAEQLRKALEARTTPPGVAPSNATESPGAESPGAAADRAARTQTARGRRLRRPAKLSLATARRYATALDLGDRGDVKGARKGLEAVVAEAPEFELAYVDLQAMAR